jgi:hypothetical protein
LSVIGLKVTTQQQKMLSAIWTVAHTPMRYWFSR